ncbi:hypothetical protein BKA66DRAFT_473520 [Pyrenochaeta sp. MPI-SDFR-AT-0127]|nr:hypothetical protein BKA66DRAFT_473520 [Pyrenochaeta sp. MPI-SDFR-AT-0127]
MKRPSLLACHSFQGPVLLCLPLVLMKTSCDSISLLCNSHFKLGVQQIQSSSVHFFTCRFI